MPDELTTSIDRLEWFFSFLRESMAGRPTTQRAKSVRPTGGKHSRDCRRRTRLHGSRPVQKLNDVAFVWLEPVQAHSADRAQVEAIDIRSVEQLALE